MMGALAYKKKQNQRKQNFKSKVN